MRVQVILTLFIFSILFSCAPEEKKVLLFGIENSRNGKDIANTKEALQDLQDSLDFSLTIRDTSNVFTEDSLSVFQAVIFSHTSGEVLNDVERVDLERYVQAGGQVLGINADPKVENEWSWYSDYMRKDRSLDESSITSLQSRLEEALLGAPIDYSLVKTERLPPENRFTKEVLDFNLNEPMELDEIEGRGILFIERRGKIKLFDFEENTTKQVGLLDVAYENEDGLLGIAIDPDFNTNNWIYLFYSAPGEKPVQHVSRFDLVDDTLVYESEKLLLEIPTIRECCHSGGALEFGPDGNLFITLGDNTNPFESSGYAPIDERPGRALWDAQKSAANTNDLRGKILRITPEDDGTYSIPEGNLFPEGTPKTRPEIYLMGLRNPFRPSIDSKTGYVYWGDVGPDAGKADSTRGPDGMGEFNQAREAGFYGWPYTRGNNQTYFDYDFAAKKSLDEFDPNKLVNDSPNNTGIEKLPPAQESLIWYGYDESEDFPWIGKGGINPMAGPVFHADDYGKGFPAYFENKLFLYEWMRDWIYVVTLDEDYNYVKADAFMPETEFSHPMDMIFGQDGMLYILEYGQKWNTQNLDARLSRVRYIEGNRDPIARITVDKEVGSAPLTVNFSGEKSMDFDYDELQYEWSFDKDEVQSKEVNPSYTFENEGIYTVSLTVSDGSNAKSSITQKIMVGNDAPTLSIDTESSNIYWDGKTFDYKINVSDLEDGNTSEGSIKPEDVKVTLTYLPEGEDIVLASIGHQQNTTPAGLKIIEGSDCKACHAENEKVNGPSYVDIANRYTKEDKNKLIASVVKGSSGVWGETMMSAHPQLTIEEVGKVIDYILSLKAPDKEVASLPLSGTFTFTEHIKERSNGKYILMASYLDQGNPNVEESRLSTTEQFVIKSPKIEAESADGLSDDLKIKPWKVEGITCVGSVFDNAFLKFEDINFGGLNSIQIRALFISKYDYEGRVEIRLGSENGRLLGEVDVAYSNRKKHGQKTYDIPIETVNGSEDLYFVFKNDKNKDQFILMVDWIFLNYNRQLQ